MNSEIDTSGARFVSVVGSTDDDDADSHMYDIPLQLPASANTPSNNSALVTFSQSGSDPVQNVHSLQTDIKTDRENPWHLQSPVTYPLPPQSVLANLGPQEAIQLVTQRAQEALYDQRNSARRVLLHQQGEFFAATHQYEAAARQHLVKTLARNNEAHKYNVQVQVHQPEHEADARFSQRERELPSRFSQESNQGLEDQREMLETEVT